MEKNAAVALMVSNHCTCKATQCRLKYQIDWYQSIEAGIFLYLLKRNPYHASVRINNRIQTCLICTAPT